jgi:hypothetical protein
MDPVHLRLVGIHANNHKKNSHADVHDIHEKVDKWSPSLILAEVQDAKCPQSLWNVLRWELIPSWSGGWHTKWWRLNVKVIVLGERQFGKRWWAFERQWCLKSTWWRSCETTTLYSICFWCLLLRFTSIVSRVCGLLEMDQQQVSSRCVNSELILSAERALLPNNQEFYKRIWKILPTRNLWFFP